MRPNPTMDLVTFTNEILIGKLYFLCSDNAINLAIICNLEYRELTNYICFNENKSFLGRIHSIKE